MITLNSLLILARKHLGTGATMDSSARLCFSDALYWYENEMPDYTLARRYAVKSLAYSVGICHKDYRRATQ